jgi:hypothetical protein
MGIKMPSIAELLFFYKFGEIFKNLSIKIWFYITNINILNKQYTPSNQTFQESFNKINKRDEEENINEVSSGIEKKAKEVIVADKCFTKQTEVEWPKKLDTVFVDYGYTVWYGYHENDDIDFIGFQYNDDKDKECWTIKKYDSTQKNISSILYMPLNKTYTRVEIMDIIEEDVDKLSYENVRKRQGLSSVSKVKLAKAFNLFKASTQKFLEDHISVDFIKNEKPMSNTYLESDTGEQIDLYELGELNLTENIEQIDFCWEQHGEYTENYIQHAFVAITLEGIFQENDSEIKHRKTIYLDFGGIIVFTEVYKLYEDYNPCYRNFRNHPNYKAESYRDLGNLTPLKSLQLTTILQVSLAWNSAYALFSRNCMDFANNIKEKLQDGGYLNASLENSIYHSMGNNANTIMFYGQGKNEIWNIITFHWLRSSLSRRN